MKRLTVAYNGTTYFDGDIEELVFTDNDQGVTVQGRLTKKTAAGSGLLDLLTNAAKPKTREENSDG